jgi:hypothetical protein
MMYKNYSQMDLPTWIIGSPLDNSMEAPAYLDRYIGRRLHVEIFNALIKR